MLSVSMLMWLILSTSQTVSMTKTSACASGSAMLWGLFEVNLQAVNLGPNAVRASLACRLLYFSCLKAIRSIFLATPDVCPPASRTPPPAFFSWYLRRYQEHGSRRRVSSAGRRVLFGGTIHENSPWNRTQSICLFIVAFRSYSKLLP